jgi:uncharacterized protein
MAVEQQIMDHVRAVLDRVAETEGVRILYAAESGSRAWGFGSPDSDYDVRFIYAHPAEWYLRLTDGRDVIERPLDERLIDLGGWDVRKALRLLLKSNPALYEWLKSPIIYCDDGKFRPAAATLFEAHASRNAIACHYHSIAKGQWRAEIDGRDLVKLKKYFYLIRPLLSLQWVATHDTPPPMALSALLNASTLEPSLRSEIIALILKKQQTLEMGVEPRIGALDDWAQTELVRLNPATLALPDRDQIATNARADQLFWHLIGLR